MHESIEKVIGEDALNLELKWIDTSIISSLKELLDALEAYENGNGSPRSIIPLWKKIIRAAALTGRLTEAEVDSFFKDFAEVRKHISSQGTPKKTFGAQVEKVSLKVIKKIAKINLVSRPEEIQHESGLTKLLKTMAEDEGKNNGD